MQKGTIIPDGNGGYTYHEQFNWVGLGITMLSAFLGWAIPTVCEAIKENSSKKKKTKK